MKLQDKTIIVNTGFYKKTVNKEQFVKRWLDHVKEISLIVDYKDDEQMEKFLKFEKFVEGLAEKQFEETYNIQNKKVTV